MFEVNGVYENRKGKYTVLEIYPPKMRVRYEDGTIAELNIAVQERIWENILAEKEAASAARNLRRSTPGNNHFIKSVTIQSEEELTFPGWPERVLLIPQEWISKIKIGDRVILYDTETQTFFGVATITSLPFKANPKDYFFPIEDPVDYFVSIDIDAVAQDLDSGVLLTSVELESLTNQAAQSNSDFDYLSFRFDELEKAKLLDGEQEELEKEANTLNNTEEIQRNLAIIHNLLNEDEFSILAKLKEAQQAANRIKNVYNKIETIEERLNSSFIELKDIAEEVELTLSNIEFNPERIEYVNSRLDLIYSLQRKHNVTNIEKLLEIKEQLDSQLQNIVSFDERIEKLKTRLKDTEDKVSDIAKKLNQNRKKVLVDIEKYVSEQLQHLGMPDATFKISIEELPEFSFSGKDKISFLFSANANIAVQNIGKVASGGEISRLMLSIKSLLSKSISLPTIIFDEIDTGVSGEIADRMASIMKKMSENMQVISITHLPQVAAKGDSHYLVYKEKINQTDTTNIRKIEGEQRISELAKMLSGENITKEAVENARVLLGK